MAFAYSFTNEVYTVSAATTGTPVVAKNLIILNTIFDAAVTSGHPAGSSGSTNYWNNGSVTGL
jgi:hypothetical protein